MEDGAWSRGDTHRRSHFDSDSDDGSDDDTFADEGMSGDEVDRSSPDRKSAKKKKKKKSKSSSSITKTKKKKKKSDDDSNHKSKSKPSSKKKKKSKESIHENDDEEDQVERSDKLKSPKKKKKKSKSNLDEDDDNDKTKKKKKRPKEEKERGEDRSPKSPKKKSKSKKKDKEKEKPRSKKSSKSKIVEDTATATTSTTEEQLHYVEDPSENNDDDNSEAERMKSLLAQWDGSDDDSTSSDSSDDSVGEAANDEEKPTNDQLKTKDDLGLRDRQIDHIILAAPDYEEAVKEFETMTGIKPTRLGGLVGLGIRAARVATDNDCYIEILAPDPVKAGPIGAKLAQLEEGTLIPYHYAIRESEFDELQQEFIPNELGYIPDRINLFSPAPDGSHSKWGMLFMQGHFFGGIIPYYVDWGKCVHPLSSIPNVGPLKSLTITAPAGSQVHKILKNVDLVTTVEGDPAMEFCIGTPEGTITFACEGPEGLVFPGAEEPAKSLPDPTAPKQNSASCSGDASDNESDENDESNSQSERGDSDSDDNENPSESPSEDYNPSEEEDESGSAFEDENRMKDNISDEDESER